MGKGFSLLSCPHHIGVVVPDLSTAMDAYISTLGVSFSVFDLDETNSAFSGSSDSFRLRIGFGSLGVSAVELIQPVSGETIHARFLAEKGPGIHHLGFWVGDLSKARTQLEALGYRSLMEGAIRDLGRFAYYEAPELHCIIEPLEFAIGFPLFLARHASVYSRNKPLEDASERAIRDFMGHRAEQT